MNNFLLLPATSFSDNSSYRNKPNRNILDVYRLNHTTSVCLCFKITNEERIKLLNDGLIKTNLKKETLYNKINGLSYSKVNNIDEGSDSDLILKCKTYDEQLADGLSRLKVCCSSLNETLKLYDESTIQRESDLLIVRLVKLYDVDFVVNFALNYGYLSIKPIEVDFCGCLNADVKTIIKDTVTTSIFKFFNIMSLFVSFNRLLDSCGIFPPFSFLGSSGLYFDLKESPFAYRIKFFSNYKYHYFKMIENLEIITPTNKLG